MKFEQMSTCVLAIGLFVLNIRSSALADTEVKRRQRLIFKMLSSSNADKQNNETVVEKRKIDDGDETRTILPVKVDILKRNTTVNLVSERGNEPPLISGSKSNLTLTMMGKFKNTWCKTEPFMQLIKEPGCLSRRVLNRFCYGQCNSFYIPRTIRKRTRKKFFKSCGFCKPKKTHTIIVTLKCPGRTKGYKHKKIKQIKQCRCMERWEEFHKVEKNWLCAISRRYWSWRNLVINAFRIGKQTITGRHNRTFLWSGIQTLNTSHLIGNFLSKYLYMAKKSAFLCCYRSF